ncbi:DUF397 domain-containing protein [Saccharopolyspora pogona]|uniref:DUF397 domain-containing protein n=1 Tax=Saccharopolyspora pogona TaxID=333966 RepID=UPI0016824439|nr:DUF397 domain-containing protein [Saccharopolyspora pogona]
MTIPRMPDGWRKSSYSSSQTNCVEVGRFGDGAAIRDTKNRAAGYFTTNGKQWANFINAVKENKFDA